MTAIFLVAWFIYVTIQAIIIMFTESFIGGLLSWFVLAFALPMVLGVLDDL